MASNTTIIEEMTTAGRGVLALLTGDKTAARYFDFSQRGLVGSFIAVLALTAIGALVSGLVGAGGGSVFEAVASNVILFATQIGVTAIVLRQFKRSDGFIHYLVADNWATFWASLVFLALSFAGLGSLVLIATTVVGLWLQVSIARSIVTLAPAQIVILLIAQAAGVLIGLFVVMGMFPISPADLEAAGLSNPPV
ncbi:MAG TPA: hypothetical protein PK286_00415 [Devosia sp.]|nr:hypothetical protein [Devosia sp.]